MTTGQIADLLQVTIPTVKRWIRDGHMHAFVTAGGHHRVTEQELRRFRAAHRMPTADAERRRVLIVDDDAQLLATLSEGFAVDARYDVETAADGYEGLIRIGRFQPDLLLLDLCLPGLDGFQVCRKVRQELGTDRIKIVAMTGYVDDTARARILETGADAFLEKPFDLAALHGACARLLDITVAPPAAPVSRRSEHVAH